MGGRGREWEMGTRAPSIPNACLPPQTTNAGIQHRVWMTGNQPEQDLSLPRPALLPNVPLVYRIEHLFLFRQGEVLAMARRGRTCVVEGCERKAAMASVVCQEHRETALGEQTDREILKMTQRLAEMGRFEDAEERREAVQTFRRQVARGDYAALFSSEMVQALAEEGKG